MESRDHKNGAKPKSHTSRKTKYQIYMENIKKIMAVVGIIAIAAVLLGSVASPSGNDVTSILPKLLPYHALTDFVYFCGVARVDKVLESSNFGNMPPRCTQPPDKNSPFLRKKTPLNDQEKPIIQGLTF